MLRIQVLNSLNELFIFFSNDPVKDSDGSPNERKERHLLLSIRSLSLAPGEKAHFTVSRNNNRTPWLEEPSDGDVKQYLQVQLEKGVINMRLFANRP